MPRTKSSVRTCNRGHRYTKSSDCPVCPTCAAEDKKRLAGDEFPPTLSAPALRGLHGAGIQSLSQLSRWSEAEIAALHGVGPNAIARLKAAMKSRGLSFR
jgi:hypothetical protein